MTASERARGLGRAYFAVQALAGALWWVCVFTEPPVRAATLGALEAVPIAALDVPLFVIASALAVRLRWARAVAVPWTALVAVALGVFAAATGQAGWGALLMTAAAVGGVIAWMLAEWGRIPADAVLLGPLGFHPSRPGSPRGHLARTLVQLALFWVFFLAVLPAVIGWVEGRWQLRIEAPVGVRAAGWAVLLLASALGLWAAFAMSLRGDGTPLPSAHATRLVVAGPYRWVRNPMALAGIAQAAGVGMLTSSWLTVAYALCGVAYWNELVRPFEERDLEQRFGAEYERYRGLVRCWMPRLRPAERLP